MNLTELRNKTKQITDYSPELAAYNETLDLFINDAYNAVWTEKRWTFASKLIYKDIYPDIVPLLPNGLTATAGVTNNSRQVTFSTPVYLLDLPYVWEGQIIELDTRDYRILKVVSQTEIHLEVPFRGTTNAANTTWRIKHRYYDLPQDAVELLHLSHRDAPVAGAMRWGGGGLNPRNEEYLQLREDLTSEFSDCYIPIPQIPIPPGEKISIQRYPNAEGPAGDIVPGTKMELCWAFEGLGGKVGPLSQPVIFTQPPQGVVVLPDVARVTFKTFDDITVASPVFNPFQHQVPNQWEGMRKRLYFNQNFNRTTGVRLSGLPVWREVTYGSTAAAVGMPGFNSRNDPVRIEDENGVYDLRYLDQLGSGNPRYIEIDGVTPMFRPYPRPIGKDFTYLHQPGAPLTSLNSADERQFRQWECRYLKKPMQLALQTDTPEMPYEFHQVIVYKALFDLFSKHDNLAQASNYEVRYTTALTRLAKRYVDRVDTNINKGQGVSNMSSGWHGWPDGNSLRKV